MHIDSKSDKSYFRSACIPSLRMEPPQTAWVGHLEFETSPTIIGGVQTASSLVKEQGV